jgi:glycosyltransferase involved in cell wall biosynthesis
LLLEDLYKGAKDLTMLKAAVREFKPDIVFLQTLLYPCYLSFFLPKSQPIVITFWNGDVVWWAKWNGIERMLKKQIVTHGVRRAQAITVNSQSAFDACLGYGGNAEKIHLIRYPGVDLDRFKPLARKVAREKLGIKARKVVLSPRGLGGYLNSDVIVNSAVEVIKKYPDTLFIFVSGVGNSLELERHRQQARSLGLEQHFKWEGQVDWDLMPLYYNAANVVISISLNDSLPNSMLEAMSCGVPVIMGDIPQIREWVVDGENGFLVGPRDISALSDRIIKCFDNRDQAIDSFINKNLILVKNKADSNKNIIAIKEMVLQVASADNNSFLIHKD